MTPRQQHLLDMAGRASLRRRFTGIDSSIGRCVADWANAEQGPAVRGWYDVRAMDTLPGMWAAWLVARLPDGTEYRIPCIPDEFNPREDKIVRPEDKPHIFKTMEAAENFAKAELPGLIHHLTKQL